MKTLQEMLADMRNANIAYKKFILERPLDPVESQMLERIKIEYAVPGAALTSEQVLHNSYKDYYIVLVATGTQQDCTELEKFIDAVKIIAKQHVKAQEYYNNYLRDVESALRDRNRASELSPTTTASTAASRSTTPREAEIAKELSLFANDITIELSTIAQNQDDPERKLAEIKDRLDLLTQRLSDARATEQSFDELELTINQLEHMRLATKVLWSQLLTDALKDAQEKANFVKFLELVKNFELNTKEEFINKKAEDIFQDMYVEHNEDLYQIYKKFDFGRSLPIVLTWKRLVELYEDGDYEGMQKLLKSLANAYDIQQDSSSFVCCALTEIRIKLWDATYRNRPNSLSMETLDLFYQVLRITSKIPELNAMIGIKEMWDIMLRVATKRIDVNIHPELAIFSTVDIPKQNDVAMLVEFLLGARPYLFQSITTDVKEPAPEFGKDALGSAMLAHYNKKATKVRYALIDVKPQRLRESLDQFLDNINYTPSFKEDDSGFYRNELLRQALLMQEQYIASFDRQKSARDLSLYYDKYTRQAQDGGNEAKVMDYLLAVISRIEAQYYRITGKSMPSIAQIIGQKGRPPEPGL